MRDEEGDNEETDSGSPATSSCIDSESASTVVVLRGGGGSRHKGDFDNLVRGARWSVIVVWLISAITVAALTNVLLARSEQATFRAQVRWRECIECPYS